MGVSFDNYGASRPSSILDLFSPSPIVDLFSTKRPWPERPGKIEAEGVGNGKTSTALQSLTDLQTEEIPEPAKPLTTGKVFDSWSFFRRREDTESLNDSSHNFLLSTLVAVGGAGLAITLAKRPLSNLNIRKSFSKLPPLTASPTLFYSSIAVSTVCSAAILYTHQRQKTSIIQAQLRILSALEEQVTRQGRSQKIALQIQHQDYLKSLQEQYQTAKDDILAATDNIKAAEKSAWDGARKATDEVRQLKNRVSNTEGEMSRLSRQLQSQSSKLEDQVVRSSCELYNHDHNSSRRLHRIEKKLRIF
jgi:hypothetical protein